MTTTTISTLSGWEEHISITLPTGRRRRPLPVSPFLWIGLIIAAIIGATSAFVLPHSTTSKSLFGPGPSYTHHHDSSLSHNQRTRNRGKIIRSITRTVSTSLFVKLEPLDNEELTVAAHHHNGSRQPSNTNVTVSDEPTPEAVVPLEETDEHHMERVRMGDDVEELTHLLAHDDVDLQPLLSPSVPISYDEHGMVQAEAAASSPTNEIAILGTDGATASISTDNEPDYPPFVRFLYTKDANGQTLASKLVNLVLLAASFGYVFTLVFSIDKGMTRGWTPVEISMRIPLDTWASYENSLSEKPVWTKTIINIVIYLLGDWLSQTLFTGKNVLNFDAGRTLKNGFVGMCFGPAVHEYYEFSDWILPVEGLTLGVTNRAFKILMDQTIYLSIKCSIYILAIGILNGDSVESSSENVKTRIKPIMFTAWKFWPLVHCVTYGLIPARHRILWVNSVDLVWNAILASKARDDIDDEDGEEDDGESLVVEASSADGSEKEGGSGSGTLEGIVVSEAGA